MVVWLCIKRFARKLFAFAALVLGILLQFVLVALLCSILPIQIGLPILMIAPFSIGAASYFIFQRIFGQRSVPEEAEHWLAERIARPVRNRARRKRAKLLALSSPALAATTLLLFFPEMLGLVTHMFYPGSAKLLGYRVSFPITWIVDETSISQDHRWSFAEGFECKGPLRAEFSRYWHLDPPGAAMYFRTSLSGDLVTRRLQGPTILSTPTVPLGKNSATCNEYIPGYPDGQADEDIRTVDCSTPRGDFFASFFGDRTVIPVFYRTLSLVERSE